MVELRRGKDRLLVSATIWTMILELARLCKWEPAGTTDPDVLGVDWSRLAWQFQYSANHAQTVSEADARRLADVLATVADDQTGQTIRDLMAGRVTPPPDLRTPITGFKLFGTDHGRSLLQKVIRFAREGRFFID